MAYPGYGEIFGIRFLNIFKSFGLISKWNVKVLGFGDLKKFSNLCRYDEILKLLKKFSEFSDFEEML